MISTVPFFTSSAILRCSSFVLKRLSVTILTGYLQAFPEMSRMLLRKDGGGAKQRDLFVVKHALKMPQRDFGFAEADITADDLSIVLYFSCR